ncbi:MAG: M18 family aminopeptidase [Polyangiaceae bacterium]|nr:M18 family aminopeptidase [Polyangiaceae bacterium]
MSVVEDLLAFLAASPTPFHAVEAATARLTAAGFTELVEHEPFALEAGDRRFVRRGGGALAAFVVPERVDGFRIVGAHTDSPNLRLKPRAAYERHGYLQLGVEVYGGALLNSWLDRDLGLAGRVHLEGGETRLVRIDRPMCRVAQLAIHLDRDVNDKGLVLNRQEHLPPIVGLSPGYDAGAFDADVARAAGVEPSAIVARELMLFDVARPTLGGAREELVFAARLDDLAMCHAALAALLDARIGEALCPVAALFDHEEVGSGSATGAGAPLLPALLERIVLARGGGRDAFHAALSRSMCVSADMAHAVHPNYPDRHEARHRPALNGGPVIKWNSQQRYATSGETAAHFATLARRLDVPTQDYAHRTDLPCGTTIGPITATLLGVRTVDVGNPMLSMHSARECGGARDPELMVRALAGFYG